jgi:succinate dehydrogenase / fumarate reductase flavoprotein subunit/L-aspartate oxidase
MHSAGDMTGAEIMRVLRDEARNRRDLITMLEFCPAIELLLDEEGKCARAILFNMETREFLVARAKAVIIATGGNGRLHIKGFATTNHYGATMDGVVMSYRAGVGTTCLHSTQYHPTGVAYPEQNVGLLITEKVRGLGAHVLNVDGEKFCFPLEPRDVESAELIKEAVEKDKAVVTPTGRYGLWLDSPMIDLLHGEGTVRKELPAKFIQFARHGIDISKEPMLVYPTLHYQNGGIAINAKSETCIPGLYSAGECEGGVHGQNRLMGNSLQDIITFGRRAGVNAREYVKNGVQMKKFTLSHVTKFEKESAEAGIENPVVAPSCFPTTPQTRYPPAAGWTARWKANRPIQGFMTIGVFSLTSSPSMIFCSTTTAPTPALYASAVRSGERRFLAAFTHAEVYPYTRAEIRRPCWCARQDSCPPHYDAGAVGWARLLCPPELITDFREAVVVLQPCTLSDL